MTDDMKKHWTPPDSSEWGTENLEVTRYREEVWITAWDNDERGHVFMLTPEQAREIAAHLNACANTAEGENHA